MNMRIILCIPIISHIDIDISTLDQALAQAYHISTMLMAGKMTETSVMKSTEVHNPSLCSIIPHALLVNNIIIQTRYGTGMRYGSLHN